ncbi:(R,R)-butanediol dehydrogenase / diacetyl reductase [Rhizoctonia solani AG-1 IB]|uniref:3-oxoacyl-[acyl-carrier-protein] reductase n=1 Tax=Thanatephorus cucumeris (strain AG1-IB / isolate 7/3/14) TaxID=1108050 RepID=M5BTH2_THACB|nr:(R,R)-butanediol dehydrogenase / diacetyl reductase [Rhizoctonia solani AG-1 IB]
MIANAGIVKIAPLLDLSTEILDLTHSVNVKGVFYCYRAAARAMIPSGGGRIIGACSVGGKTSKLSLTHTAAQEWAEYGITVNAYAPGPINTEMWLKNVISANDTGPILDQKATELSATHKKSTPEQVAGLVSFLLSPAADNMTGQCISIDGGWNMD